MPTAGEQVDAFTRLECIESLMFRSRNSVAEIEQIFVNHPFLSDALPGHPGIHPVGLDGS